MRCPCCEPEAEYEPPSHTVPVDASAPAVRAMPRILQRMTTRMAKLVQREDPNVSFYRGVTISAPGKTGERGDLVDEIHRSWDRERLEASHGYIQWLFPIFAGDSMNWRASPLTYAGAAKIREDRVMSERVRRSYVLFLDFLGFRLADAWTGRVEAATDCAARMAHLDAHPHNFKRISRVLASLGHLGFRRYKAPLLAALEREIKLGTLRTAAAALVHHWRPLVHDEGSEAYEARTLERAEDRVDGACFVLSRSVSLEDAMPHDVRDELGGGVPRLQTTPARVASDAPPSWRLDALAKRRSLM